MVGKFGLVRLIVADVCAAGSIGLSPSLPLHAKGKNKLISVCDSVSAKRRLSDGVVPFRCAFFGFLMVLDGI